MFRVEALRTIGTKEDTNMADRKNRLNRETKHSSMHLADRKINEIGPCGLARIAKCVFKLRTLALPVSAARTATVSPGISMSLSGTLDSPSVQHTFALEATGWIQSHCSSAGLDAVAFKIRCRIENVPFGDIWLFWLSSENNLQHERAIAALLRGLRA